MNCVPDGERGWSGVRVGEEVDLGDWECGEGGRRGRLDGWVGLSPAGRLRAVLTTCQSSVRWLLVAADARARACDDLEQS